MNAEMNFVCLCHNLIFLSHCRLHGVIHKLLGNFKNLKKLLIPLGDKLLLVYARIVVKALARLYAELAFFNVLRKRRGHVYRRRGCVALVFIVVRVITRPRKSITLDMPRTTALGMKLA